MSQDQPVKNRGGPAYSQGLSWEHLPRQAPGSVPGAPSIDLAVRALPLLSWDGFGIVEARAWSARRLVVYILDSAEHHRRQAEGNLPTADPFLLRCLVAQGSAVHARPGAGADRRGRSR